LTDQFRIELAAAFKRIDEDGGSIKSTAATLGAVTGSARISFRSITRSPSWKGSFALTPTLSRREREIEGG
jgi:hypothetical protein